MGLDQSIYQIEKSEIKYWRKFGELHNMIVEIYERHGWKGEDNCHDFLLTESILKEIISRLETKTLPDHSGFFFGGSNLDDDERIQDAIYTFKGLLEDTERRDYEYVYNGNY